MGSMGGFWAGIGTGLATSAASLQKTVLHTLSEEELLKERAKFDDLRLEKHQKFLTSERVAGQEYQQNAADIAVKRDIESKQLAHDQAIRWQTKYSDIAALVEAGQFKEAQELTAKIKNAELKIKRYKSKLKFYENKMKKAKRSLMMLQRSKSLAAPLGFLQSPPLAESL